VFHTVLCKSNVAAYKSQTTLTKADILLDRLIELVDGLEDGIELSLQIGHQVIPVKLKIDLQDE